MTMAFFWYNAEIEVTLTAVVAGPMQSTGNQFVADYGGQGTIDTTLHKIEDGITA
jgi:hypothetical protein